MRPSLDSFGRGSVDSSISVQVIVDAVYLRLNEVDKKNARIKKELMRWNDLNAAERWSVRSLLQEASDEVKHAQN